MNMQCRQLAVAAGGKASVFLRHTHMQEATHLYTPKVNFYNNGCQGRILEPHAALLWGIAVWNSLVRCGDAASQAFLSQCLRT